MLLNWKNNNNNNNHVHAKDNVKVRRVIKVAKDVVISPRFVIKIPIKVKKDSEPLINNWDYLFKSDRLDGYYYLINTDPTRPYINYARYYIHDIIIFFKIFGQYIEHLDTIFELFNELGITFINEIYLNLHKDYRIPDIKSKKLTRQRIYPVIFVTHLEPAPHGKDLYNRPRNDYSPPVEEDAVDLNNEQRNYIIEKLIDRRYRQRR